MDRIMRNSILLASCLPLLLRYMLISSSSFLFPLPYLSWLLMVENYSRRSLLLMSPLTFYISPGWSMLTVLIALLRSVLWPVIPMLWDTLFL